MNIDYLEAFKIIPRSITSLVVLFFITKLMGKKQVSELSLFDYVIGISIGNFAAEMTINLESEELYGIIAVLLFGGIAYLVSVGTMKSIKLRRFFMGSPTILIEHGKILQDNFYKVKYDINDMLEQCRVNGYFDISEIDYAIVEANGELSILAKSEYLPVNRNDMKLKVSKNGLCANVIIDGKVMYNNLKKINKDEKWLNKELKLKGKDISDIILATVDINDKVVFYERNKGVVSLDVLE